jgi:hypothetical protein
MGIMAHLFLDYTGLSLEDIHGLCSSKLGVRVVPKLWRWGRNKPLESKFYAAGGTLIDAFWKTLLGNYVDTKKIYVKAQAKDKQAFWRAWKRPFLGEWDGKHDGQATALWSCIYPVTLCRRFSLPKKAI